MRGLVGTMRVFDFTGARAAWTVVLLALLAFIAVVQVWIASAGGVAWSRGSKYVSLQADAFAHGQLSLRVAPAAEMLALADPYDPVANIKYRLHDALLFDGKYYLYWGPAPAMLAAGVCRVLGVRADFGDQYLVMGLMFGTVVACCVLMLQARAAFFPRCGVGTVIVPVVSLGLGMPMLFMLGRPAIYEAIICAGQFFLMGGFCAAFVGMSRLRSDRRWGGAWMTVAGILWALSVGSRVSLIPGVAAAAAVTIWFLPRGGTGWRGWMVAMAGLAAPVVAAVALLGIYNFLRFHSFTDFGMHWQLSSLDEHAEPPGEFFQLRYFLVDTYCYLLVSPRWQGGFPFVLPSGSVPRFARGFGLAAGYRVEAIVGLVWSQPILMLAVVGVWLCLGRGGRKNAGGAGDQGGRTGGERALMRWLTASLCAAGVIGFFPALVFETVTTRYLLDAVPCLTVLAAFGYWGLLAAFERRGRGLVHGVGGVMAVWQSGLGVLFGLVGLNGNFLFYNPGLYQSIKEFFDRW